VVNVVVTNLDGQTATAVGGYTYTQVPTGPPPVVTSVTPGSGSINGNTRVVVTGTGFVQGSTVTFGGVAALPTVPPTATTATTITVVTPGGPAGLVDVTVTNPDLQKFTLTGGFTYVAAPPVVTALNRHGAPQTGGAQIVIAGTGLVNAVSVTFGGAPATGLTFDPLTGALTVTVPSSPLGPAPTEGFVNIVVTNVDGQFTTVPNFHYGALPVITSWCMADPVTLVCLAAPNDTVGIPGSTLVIDGTDFGRDATQLAGVQIAYNGFPATDPKKGGAYLSRSATRFVMNLRALNPPGPYQIIFTKFDGQFTISTGAGFTVPGP
jgi:IPT/TIG domain